MFEVAKDKKTLSKISSVTFSSVDIKERQDLQEWVANTPECLGEELLIIQKEFSGFDDTKERLDLLALDKEGNLVIIENKLDDSGKDVVWQALRYVAYCSTLTTSQIVKIFQDYLKQGNASEQICEFLEKQTIEEVSLNEGHSQRMILVSGEFRKEVTSTVLWLIYNGVRAQCIKFTPYRHDEKIYLDVSQVIPTPEEKDYMIRMSSKTTEENIAKATANEKNELHREFWEQLLQYFDAHNFQLFTGISPQKTSWMHKTSDLSSCKYSFVFKKYEIQTEFYFDKDSKAENKEMYDSLYASKDGIEQAFGQKLNWERLDDRKASRIKLVKEFDSYDRDNWPDMNKWLYENMVKLEQALAPYITALKK